MVESVRRPSLLSEVQVRQLTGLSRSQFAGLIAELGPRFEAEREERLSARRRARAFGAGRPYDLPFAGRLLVTLVYLRWNVTLRFVGAVFGVGKDVVHRAVADLTPLLAAHGITAPDGARLGDDDTLEMQLRALSEAQRAALIDGTFVPVPRPGKGGWEAQTQQYSPHRHRHVNTFQALTDDIGNLLWVGAACDGATHDLTAIFESDVAVTLADTEVTVIADKAYVGIKAKLGLAHAFTPYRCPASGIWLSFGVGKVGGGGLVGVVGEPPVECFVGSSGVSRIRLRATGRAGVCRRRWGKLAAGAERDSRRVD